MISTSVRRARRAHHPDHATDRAEPSKLASQAKPRIFDSAAADTESNQDQINPTFALQ